MIRVLLADQPWTGGGCRVRHPRGAGRYDDAYTDRVVEVVDAESGIVRVELGWPYATINRDSLN